MVFQFFCCLSFKFMWNPFSHLLDLSHGFQMYGGFSCHFQLIHELLLSLSVILIQQCLQFVVFKLFRWFSTFFVSHVKIATFEFFKPLKTLWFTKSMLTVSFDKYSMWFCSSFLQMVSENQCCANRSFQAQNSICSTLLQTILLYETCMLWLENLCQNKDGVNDAVWRQLH